MDSFFWRSVAIEFLAMVAFLFSVITTICYNTDGQLIGLDSDKQLLASLVFGLSIFLLVYFTAGLRCARVRLVDQRRRHRRCFCPRAYMPVCAYLVLEEQCCALERRALRVLHTAPRWQRP
jgi:hypothetical protein